MAFSNKQIREYCQEILRYFATGVKRIDRYGETLRILEFDGSGFYFCDDICDGSVKYHGEFVVDKDGNTLSNGIWEFELQCLYEEALRKKDAASLMFHWNYYEYGKDFPFKDHGLARKTIDAKVEERRLRQTPDLYERLEKRGKCLSAAEIVIKAELILKKFGEESLLSNIYEGKYIAETFYETKGVKISSENNGEDIEIWDNGKMVFRCFRLYDDIYYDNKNESENIRHLIEDDYVVYVESFEQGDWELVIDDSI